MFLVVLQFGRRYFVLGHPYSAQTDQPHQVVWSRIGDILVIVIDHRLIGELPRFCGKQECGDVGISTPNTLRCMHCHTTAPHGLGWFDVRTSRFWNFRMFFSFSNFLTHCSHLLLDMSLITQHWYLIDLTILEGSGSGCWRSVQSDILWAVTVACRWCAM